MKTVFAALCAKYIHTALGARSVAAYARAKGLAGITLWERTINHRHRVLLRELAEMTPDVVVFSLYIWNVEMACRLADDLRKILPDAVLVAAGPEASYHTHSFLEAHPAFDFAVAGEGEVPTTALLRVLGSAGSMREQIPIIPAVFDRRTPGAQPPAPLPFDLDMLPFAYPDLDDLSGRIFYYESMRGCPFRCSYCLSSIDEGPVRFRSLPLVFRDLQRFLAAGVRQVKLVDRTFNCDSVRARAIWRWLSENDNGVTGFHFELAGELLDDESCALLATLRPGLVQFEIGVQSTHRETLKAVRRPAHPEKLFARVERLGRGANIHLHLDLIAGLPLEDYASFARSFDAVYACRPDQLQLGFLKVLRGSEMEREAERYGIAYSATAPYEVLKTGALSFGQLARLHSVADQVERYYNSGRFSHLIEEICGAFASPFAFYESLADFYTAAGHDAAPLAKLGQYELLGDFLRARGLPITPRHQWLCRYDMALHEKPKRAPNWVEVDGAAPHRARILAFYASRENRARYLPQHRDREPKWLLKTMHIEVFPFCPETGAPEETALLFTYDRHDPGGRTGGGAQCRVIALEKPGKV